LFFKYLFPFPAILTPIYSYTHTTRKWTNIKD
jgi:hypothetical protein